MIVVLISFILTVCIYSYLLDDNPIYRVGVHLLVGVSASYASLIVVKELVVPVFKTLPEGGNNSLWLIPILFSLFLALKLSPKTAPLGNWAVAFLVGVGGAVALVGTIFGTLLPQINAGQKGFLGILSAILTVFTLLYFQFTNVFIDRNQDWIYLRSWQEVGRNIGRAVLMITLGTIFANTLNTSLVLFIDRLNYFLYFLRILL